ncbi:stAR-related lipid transfer protein 6-like isoform X2 [Hyperolius riggenbachi]|uniref:stAR-related lipid transfer protein 6-like isoform X2 n=1 Tax=Hyperolius riggenbachi TaxID=752182 RepID=UPI0035A2D1FF
MDYQKLADDVSQKILTYYQDSSGWKVVKSTKGITVSWKPSNEYSGNVYRGEGIIEEVPEKVIPYMYLAEYRRKWDKAVKSYSLVDRIDQNTVVSHAITHTYGFGIISSREFVDMVHIRKYDGGVISTNSISIEHEKCPITSSHIRGFNNPCGYICSPLPENLAHSKLVVIIQPELGGLLPRSVVETAIPSNVVDLITYVQEGIKELNTGS